MLSRLRNPMTARWLRLQYGWVLLGFGYNLISLIKRAIDGTALAPTDPVAGIIFVGMGLGVISIGLTRLRKTYASLALIFACLLAYSGVYLHVAAYLSSPTLNGYASPIAWAAAVLINLFGVTVLIWGAVVAFGPVRTRGRP